MRWARRDSERFRAEHALPQPFPAPDLAPFTEALHAADTPAEFSYVLNSLLDAVEPFLNEVINHLSESRTWKNRHRNAEPGSPPILLRDAASRIATGIAMAAHADLDILRAHYDPPPDLEALRTARPTPPAAPPPSPPSGPRHPRR
ncbi:hypothetical protein AB0D57_27395 [Streptomyces sp. NPDC048275]|uniref:hypothetical protein n=1 Tax=Streptomyces sp. NPDC048275 TaxID=3155629 RepID=UPI0033F7A3C1